MGRDPIETLRDGDTVVVEKRFSHFKPPPPEKTAKRVFFVGDHRTYYTMRAVELLKMNDKVQATIKASEYGEKLYLWITDWSRIQSEELRLGT